MLVGCCLAALSFVASVGVRASETDQFTLPPQHLDDLGPDVAAIVRGVLHAEVDELNAWASWRGTSAQAGAQDARDERRFAERVYEKTGVGFPETTLEGAIRYGRFPGRNVQFAPRIEDSIYAGTFSPFLLTHLFDVPTVRLYGVDLGTDKIGHMFQQGYEYFALYVEARDRGFDEATAVARAVLHGVGQERTVFGAMTTGVYSNGDLAGNYAGFKFYRNLFHEVRIGDRVLGPIVRRDGSRWIVDPERDNPDLLEPYVSEHLSEAYNPSLYYFSVDVIRGHVRDRCASWLRQVPGFDEASYRARLERVQTWFGEPYGWDLPADRAVSLLDCPAFAHSPRGVGAGHTDE